MIAALVAAIVYVHIGAPNLLMSNTIVTGGAGLPPIYLLSKSRSVSPVKNIFVNYVTPHIQRLSRARFSVRNVVVGDSVSNHGLHLHALPLWNEAAAFAWPWKIKPKGRLQCNGKNSAPDAPTDVSSGCAARIAKNRARLKPHIGILIKRVSNQNRNISTQLSLAECLLASRYLSVNFYGFNDFFGIDRHRLGDAFHGGCSAGSFGDGSLHSFALPHGGQHQFISSPPKGGGECGDCDCSHRADSSSPRIEKTAYRPKDEMRRVMGGAIFVGGLTIFFAFLAFSRDDAKAYQRKIANRRNSHQREKANP